MSRKGTILTFVPNAPCGVESSVRNRRTLRVFLVPNAPCGVESTGFDELYYTTNLFLMHRVELKVFSIAKKLPNLIVPNAPCGVESS